MNTPRQLFFVTFLLVSVARAQESDHTRLQCRSVRHVRPWSFIPCDPGVFNADPAARVFNGRLYVYTSWDEPSVCAVKSGFQRFCMPGYRLYSTSDERLRTWESHGPILKSENVPWVYQGARGTARMWAPDAVRGNDGKYYLFFPAPYQRIDQMLIGVAVSKSPTGPFIPREKPIFGTDGIDPSVVRLSNGQWVLFTSGGLTGSIFVANIDPEFRKVSQKRTVLGLKDGYKEGPHALVYRRKLLMYYALSSNGKYSIQQAGANMWKRPDWGFWNAGEAVAPFDGRTNHASVARYKGRTWIFWHRHMERYSARWSRRRVVFSPTSWLWWGKQRTIRPVRGKNNSFYIRK